MASLLDGTESGNSREGGFFWRETEALLEVEGGREGERGGELGGCAGETIEDKKRQRRRKGREQVLLWSECPRLPKIHM